MSSRRAKTTSFTPEKSNDPPVLAFLRTWQDVRRRLRGTMRLYLLISGSVFFFYGRLSGMRRRTRSWQYAPVSSDSRCFGTSLRDPSKVSRALDGFRTLCLGWWKRRVTRSFWGQATFCTGGSAMYRSFWFGGAFNPASISGGHQRCAINMPPCTTCWNTSGIAAGH